MQPREQDDTGVDVGSNETAPARRSADPGLVKEMRDDVRVVYGPSVNPPESRALHTLAATFLLAFAMLFAAALPAQALVLGSSAPTLSIEDASAAENAGYLLFDVTLSRASPHTVKVDFETTSGGTATEGVDYWARDYTHVIPAGETTAQMGFALIADTVAAAGETVMVRLSNARLINKRGKKKADLNITDAEATGTINAPTTTTTNVPNLTIRDQRRDRGRGRRVARFQSQALAKV